MGKSGDVSLQKASNAYQIMLLSGNMPSQSFPLDSFEVSDVRDLVKKAIEDGAAGGGQVSS